MAAGYDGEKVNTICIGYYQDQWNLVSNLVHGFFLDVEWFEFPCCVCENHIHFVVTKTVQNYDSCLKNIRYSERLDWIISVENPTKQIDIVMCVELCCLGLKTCILRIRGAV